MSRVDQIVKRIDDAVTLPMVVQKVVELCGSPTATAKMVAAAVSSDPVLAAKLLRTANSSLFGFVSKTQDIDQAVVRLGVKQVRSITLALGVGKLFSCPEDKDGYSRLEVWKHSVAVGLLGEIISITSHNSEIKKMRGEALLAGLVHDIGIILADQHLSDKFKEVPGLSHQLDQPFHAVEEKRFGFNHAELGSLVLAKWRFPDSLCEAVAHHHRPEKAEDDLLGCVIGMAECLAVRHGVGYCDLRKVPMQRFGWLQTKLGLAGPLIDKVNKQFEDKAEEALKVFEIDVSEEAPSHRTVHKVG